MHPSERRGGGNYETNLEEKKNGRIDRSASRDHVAHSTTQQRTDLGEEKSIPNRMSELTCRFVVSDLLRECSTTNLPLETGSIDRRRLDRLVKSIEDSRDGHEDLRLKVSFVESVIAMD